MDQYWIWFANLTISPHSKQRLVAKFRDARAIYEARDPDLRAAGLTSDRERSALSKKSLREVERILKVCDQQKINIITFDMETYPNLLREIHMPPYVLYTRGRFPNLDEQLGIAVVGTRKADKSGINIAHRFAGDLTRAGAYVISGMAEGIDGAANTGALDAGGETLAVLGCGVDVCYPTFHDRLMAQILERGAVVSEFAPGTPPYASNFPIRNRIMSGLARGVLAIQVPQQSGAKITIDFAAQQNRDLFVVPGNIDSPLYTTGNRLIRDGAKMVLHANDILEDYRSLFPHIRTSDADVPSGASAADEGLSDDERLVLNAIGVRELSVDEIIRETELEAQTVLAALTMLELQGAVSQNAGKRFRLAQGF